MAAEFRLATQRSHPGGTYGPRPNGYRLRYLPTSPVKYPASWSHVASVSDSSNRSPSSLVRTCVWWLYSPERIVAREGQQSGVEMNAFGNHSQLPSGSWIWAWSHGMAAGWDGNVSNDWSSVRITMMFGRSPRGAGGGEALRLAAINAAAASTVAVV